MKKSDFLKLELLNLEKEISEKVNLIYRNGDVDKSSEERWKIYYDQYGRKYSNKKQELEKEIMKEERREIEVGDGVTICLFSDRHAATVIKKTKTTITVQHDKAILDEKFKPEYVPGGFSAHCINQQDQKYTYERNEEGRIEKFNWSEKFGRYQGGNGSIVIINGRHEFYDYNF